MSSVNLSEKLLRFIQDNVPTMDAVDVLILLYRNSNKEWTAEEVANETRGSPSVAATFMAWFESQGLLEKKPGLRFHYHPDSAELDQMVAALAQAYVERPVSLVRAIYASAGIKQSPAQAFADAFKLRKE